MNIKTFFNVILMVVVILSTATISKVSAASVSFSTSGGGKVFTGTIIKVNVNVNVSGGTHKTVESTTTFNNLTYISASANSKWTPVAPVSVSGNKISFTGAMLSGTASGSTLVMSITFKAPNNPGSASISTSGSVAILEDGHKLTSGGGNTVSYNIETPPAPPKAAAGSVKVSSITHSDSNNWYKEKKANISWEKNSDVLDFSYIVDQNESSIPDDNSEGNSTSIIFESELKEGVNFFHIKAKNDVGWGSTTHFKINIDTVLPDPFTITLVNDENNNILYFATNDSLSGVLKYTIKTGEIDLGEQKSGFKLESSKKNNIIVTAFDKSGNIRESKLSSVNTAITTPTVTSIKSINNTVNTQLNNKFQNPIQKNGILFLILSIGLFLYSMVVSVLFYKNKKQKSNNTTVSQDKTMN